MLKLSIVIVIVAAVLIGGAAVMPILYDGSGQASIHPTTKAYGKGEPYSQRVTAHGAVCWGWGWGWDPSPCGFAWRDVTLDNDDPEYLARSASGFLIVAAAIAVLSAGALAYRSVKRRTQRL